MEQQWGDGAGYTLEGRRLAEILFGTGSIATTAIADGMLADLAAGRIALHRTPFGAGKSYSIARAAAIRSRAGLRTLIAVPTVRMAVEMAGWLEDGVPDASGRGAVAKVYGRVHNDGDGGESEEDMGDGGRYLIYDGTKIIVSTHAQLGRRGFSKYLRGIWGRIGGDWATGPFAIIIDEISGFIRQARREIALGHRARRRRNPDRSGGVVEPLADCPKSNRSGNCANCELISHGGCPEFNRFGIRELRYPQTIRVDADGQYLDRPLNPLTVDLARVGLGEMTRMTDTMRAAPVRSWYGTPIDAATRRTAPISLFRRDPRTGRQPVEQPEEVLAHLLMFADRPVITVESAVDSDGTRLDGAALAARIATQPRGWDQGIIFPWATCEVPRLCFTDMLALEQLRRFADREGVGVIGVGAILLPSDPVTLRVVWPELVIRNYTAGSSNICK